jgi:hypothetical protein
MALFTLVDEPQLSGNRLSWKAVLDPGTFEMAAAGSTVDGIDCFRLTSNDPAGLDTTSELTLQIEALLPHDVMPGDTYENSWDLGLADGYYHVLLTIDSTHDGAVYQLNVRVENGWCELKTWHLHMA